MGGIAGILSADESSGGPPILETMLRAIAHRGPDDSGMVRDGRAALGFVRCTAGPRTRSLPPSNRDHSVSIVFDGEILNVSELQAELQKCGRAFAAAEDADLVLEAYRVFGEDCVRHLEGAWALAIWDGKNQTLFASRDRWGMRPFFYTTAGRDFVFASEIKSLVRHPGVDRQIDAVALDQVFTLQTTIPPRTILTGVFELPPGHSLYWSDGALRVFRYWQLDFGASRFDGDESQAEERLFELLSDATRRSLTGAEGAGALAGGLPSQLAAEFAGRLGDRRLPAFSVAFHSSGQCPPAQPRGTLLSGEPFPGVVRSSPAEIASIFPEIVQHAETPVLDLHAVSLFLAARSARAKGCRALVTGAGADELFGGSEIFAEAAIRRFWGRHVDSEFRPVLLKRLYPDLPWQASQPLPYWQAYFHVRNDELSNPLFSHLARWGQTARLKKYFSADLRAEIGDYDAQEEARLRLPAGFKHWDPLSQAQFLESSWPLSVGALSRLDRMTVAHGVSAHVPFLDRRVAEFATALPPHLKLRGIRGLVLLKRLAGRLLSRTKNEGEDRTMLPTAAACLFGTPELPLVHEELDALLGRERITNAGLFDPAAVARLVRKARCGETIATQDQAALVGILSTQLLVEGLARRSPAVNGQLTSAAGQSLVERR
jgi:asparagine synthase (glutamine-hydrolysing)